MSVYTVAKGKDQIGGLALLDVDPKIVTNPEVDASLATALVKVLTGAADGHHPPVDGLDVVEATVSGSTFAAWYDGDVVSLMIGSNERQIEGLRRRLHQGLTVQGGHAVRAQQRAAVGDERPVGVGQRASRARRP